MRKLPILATTLLCSSLALAQVEDGSAPATEDAATVATEATPAVEETAPAAEESAPAAEEPAPVAEAAPAAEETYLSSLFTKAVKIAAEKNPARLCGLFDKLPYCVLENEEVKAIVCKTCNR